MPDELITLPKKELDNMLNTMANQTKTLLIINEWIKQVNARLDSLENTNPYQGAYNNGEFWQYG